MTNSIKKLALTSVMALALSACATYDNDGMDDDNMMEKDEMSESMKDDTMMAENPMVGGAAMMANKTIVHNASAAPNLTTLVSLVKQAGLVDTLSGSGPFTVFAPTNSAFSALPTETTSMLMMDENKDKLANILKAHVVSGNYTSADLVSAMAGKSSYDVRTVAGNTIKFYNFGDGLRIANADGTLSKINTADVMQSNGVVHVIDTVLVPK